MTVPVSKTTEVASSTRLFESFDKKVCRIIVCGLHEELQYFLNKGLAIDYCLKEDVFLEKEGVKFPKGASLIFIIVQSCTVTVQPWDLWMMMTLLLDKGACLDTRCTYAEEQGGGGGEINVLDYACLKASQLNEDILCTLLKKISSRSALSYLEKITDNKIKESIKSQLFPKSYVSEILEITEPETSPLIVDECKLCEALVEGDSKSLRTFLDSGLSPNYLITKERMVGGFFCKPGCSLLLLVLQACVETSCVLVLFENLALLLEKGVNLQQECFGINPLFYICEHAEVFLEEVITSFLSSVNKTVALAALEKIQDPEYKERIQAILTSKESIFRFSNEEEEEEKLEIQKIKRELIAFSEQVTSSSSSSAKSLVSEASSSLKSSRPWSINSFFHLYDSIIVDVEKSEALNASTNYGVLTHKLIFLIMNNNWSLLEEILQNTDILKTYNDEVKCSSNGRETLFSALIHKIRNPRYKHKVCFLFIKHGISKEEIVYSSHNLLSFLCSFRSGSNFIESSILLQTVCLAIFYYNEGSLVTEALKNCKTKNETKKISFLFQDKQGFFSTSSFHLTSMIACDRYIPVIIAFLEISLIYNRDVITGHPWSIDIVFSLLSEVIKELRKFASDINPESQKRKTGLFSLLRALLLAGRHPTSYMERAREKYASFTEMSLKFKNPIIRREVEFLVKKYWQDLADYDETVSRTTKPTIDKNMFLGTFGTFSYSYGATIDKLILAIENTSFTELEDLLKDAKSLEQCNKEVKAFASEETCCSALLHAIKDPFCRHQICYIFLKNGISDQNKVYKNQNFIDFLCKLRGRVFTQDRSSKVFFQTLCLAIMCLEEDSLIEKAVTSCCPEDIKRLKAFFDPAMTGCSNKQLSIQERITTPFYFAMSKAFIETSILRNRNIMTGEPWGLSNMCLLLKTIIKKMSLSAALVYNPTKDQEKNIIQKNRIIYLYEFLLMSCTLPQFLLKNHPQEYSFMINYMNSLVWKSEELKNFICNLLVVHWGGVVVRSGEVAEIGKRKRSTGESEPEVKQAKLDLYTRVSKLTKLNPVYLHIDLGEKVEALIPDIIRGNFSVLENVLTNDSLLKEYNDEIKSKNSEETLLSALMHKIKDIKVHYEMCRLFLQHGTTWKTPIYKELNIVQFCCSLYQFACSAVFMKMMCFFVLIFKKEISSIIFSLLHGSFYERDKRTLMKFFITDRGEFLLRFTDMSSLCQNEDFAPLVQGFIEASLLLNQNVITEEPWDPRILFDMLGNVMDTLCNIQLDFHTTRKKNILLNVLETFLLAGLHTHNYREENKGQYLYYLEEKFSFRCPSIAQEVTSLIKSYWGHMAR